MITNVLIDVDNTLLDFNKCAEAAIKTGFLKWNIEYSEKVFPVFLEVNDSLWRKIETGEIDKKTLYQLRWKTIFERLGINADGPTFEQDFRNIFQTARSLWTVHMSFLIIFRQNILFQLQAMPPISSS